MMTPFWPFSRQPRDESWPEWVDDGLDDLVGSGCENDLLRRPPLTREQTPDPDATRRRRPDQPWRFAPGKAPGFHPGGVIFAGHLQSVRYVLACLGCLRRRQETRIYDVVEEWVWPDRRLLRPTLVLVDWPEQATGEFIVRICSRELAEMLRQRIPPSGWVSTDAFEILAEVFHEGDMEAAAGSFEVQTCG
jgi:hypothetical protein